MRETQFYTDCHIAQNSLIAASAEAIYLLQEGCCLLLSEVPPCAQLCEPLGLWRSLLAGDKSQFPTTEHSSPLLMGYFSAAETFYFFASGAVIRLQSRAGADQLSFLSCADARAQALTLEQLSANALYTKIALPSEVSQGTYPVERCYILAPGILAVKEQCLLQRYPQELIACSSIEFVQKYLLPVQNPAEIEPFLQIPRLFCELTQAQFDFDAWCAAFSGECLPYCNAQCRHPFLVDEKCMAEILIVSSYEEVQYHPYEDSYTLVLQYRAEFTEAAEKLVRKMLALYPNVVRFTAAE